MNREEVTARLCAIMNTVNERITGYAHPADCICGRKYEGYYQNSGHALEFIEAAVFEALVRRALEESK